MRYEKFYIIIIIIMMDKITKKCIERLINEVNKPDNKLKLENEILAPIFSNVSQKIYPYVSLLLIMYSVILILILVIIILIIIYNKKT